MNSINQIFTILSDIYQSCQIIQTGCLLRIYAMLRQLKAIVIITKQKGAMTKYECDGYYNKFDANNNKI